MANEVLSGVIIVQALKEAAIKMQEKHVKQLQDLDATIGDGDLGITISKGFRAVEKILSVAKESKVGKILREVGMAFNEANPSTCGVFFATAFSKAGAEVKDEESIDVNDLSRMFQSAVQGIIKRGKAKIGDKTILDALVPASEAFDEVAKSNGSIYEAFQGAVCAAKKGVERTKELKAKIGRARSFAERTRGIQDPGATAAYLFLNELLDSLSTI